MHGNGVGSVEPELAAVVAAAANSEESDEEDAVPAVTLAKRFESTHHTIAAHL